MSAALREQLYQSGSRLKARLVGDAKARTFQGFFDEELGIRCEFARASDGRMYCLPTGAPPSLVYSDAECTVPVGKELDECSKSDGYTVVESGHVLDCEPPVTRVYEPVSKPLPEKSYFASFDGCSAGSPAPEHYARLSEVDPSRFVSAVEKTVQADDGTGMVFLLAEDGAGQLGHLLHAGGGECWVTDIPGRELGCSPIGSVWVGKVPFAYADDACKGEPLVPVLSRDCGKAPRLWAFDEKDRDHLQVFDGTKKFEGATYEPRDGTCQPEPGNALPYYEFVQSKQPFPTLHEVRRGEGRLKLLRAETEGGQPLAVRDPAFVDTLLDVACSPAETLDGQLRCIPTAHVSATVFADPACTQPLALDSQDDPANHWWVAEEPSECGRVRVSDVRELGKPYEGVSYELASGDGKDLCIESDEVGSLYRLGPSRMDDLVPLEEHEG